MPMDEAKIKRKLEAERERLCGLKDALAADGLFEESRDVMSELSMSDQHPADVGTETFERARDYATLEQVEARLADVERALERLQNGDYGNCEACGRPIGAARLAARPEARFCIEDQQLVEHETRAAVERGEGGRLLAG